MYVMCVLVFTFSFESNNVNRIVRGVGCNKYLSMKSIVSLRDPLYVKSSASVCVSM